MTTVHYNSVYKSGVNGDTAYLVASLSLFSIDFSLVNHQAIALCYFSGYGNEQGNGQNGQGQYGQYYDQDNGQRRVQDGYYDEQGDNQGDEYYDEQGDNNQGGNNQGGNYQGGNNQAQCPYDGSYPYKVDYVLPSAGSESASWLASGWTGSGVLKMYATRNEEVLIGDCTLQLSTFVTKEDEDSLLGAPSAAATAGIILAIIFATLLMCFYCYCCIKSRKTRKDNLNPGDDVISSFRRMDEDNHSKPPTISVDAQSQATSKKSAKEMI